MNYRLTLLILMMMNTGLYAQDYKTLYDFKAKTINGKDYDFSQLKGKRVLIVNTASKCGHTPQYKDLQELYKLYGGNKFTIIGFPANNFMHQEPGTNEEIEQFCTKNYGVTFQMMEKISVKGKDIHPLYAWLTQKSENGVLDAPVKWNFQKFLINEEGKVVAVFDPGEKPLSENITKLIKEK